MNIDDLLTAVGTVTTRSFTWSTRDPPFSQKGPQNHSIEIEGPGPGPVRGTHTWCVAPGARKVFKTMSSAFAITVGCSSARIAAFKVRMYVIEWVPGSVRKAWKGRTNLIRLPDLVLISRPVNHPSRTNSSFNSPEALARSRKPLKSSILQLIGSGAPRSVVRSIF